MTDVWIAAESARGRSHESVAAKWREDPREEQHSIDQPNAPAKRLGYQGIVQSALQQMDACHRAGMQPRGTLGVDRGRDRTADRSS